jgi:D-alanyl-D-alanine carboxypeptidase
MKSDSTTSPQPPLRRPPASDPSTLCDLIDALYGRFEQPDSPGAMVAALYGDQLMHLRGYGMADREFGIAWQPNLRYPIASITKVFVGELLQRLDDQSALSLGWPLSKFFHFANEQLGAATLLQVATMSAGLRHDEVALGLVGANDWTNERLLASTLVQPQPQFLPGTAQLYSCAGYRLLASVIETVAGEPFGDALRRHTFAPLGMEDTCVFVDWDQSELRRVPRYRCTGPGRWARFQDGGQSSGDGAILSTPEDLVKFARYMRSREGHGLCGWQRLAGHRPLLAEGLFGDYGLGVLTRHPAGVQTIGHSGSTNCHIAYLPEHDVTLICLHNTDELHNAGAIKHLVKHAFAADDPLPASTARIESAPSCGVYGSAQTGLAVRLGSRHGEDHLQLLDQRAGSVAASANGESLLLVDSAEALQCRIDIGEDGRCESLTLQEGACAPVRCDRLRFRALPSWLANRFEGWYAADDASGANRVRRSGDALELVLGAGTRPEQRLRLRWAGGAFFYAEGTTVRFQVGDRGSMQMLLSRALCRNLRFTRLGSADRGSCSTD